MFKVGQRVVCIENVPWMSHITMTRSGGPSKDEELEIDFIEEAFGFTFLGFNKYHQTEGYHSVHFRPLIDETVESIIELVKPKPVPVEPIEVETL